VSRGESNYYHLKERMVLDAKVGSLLVSPTTWEHNVPHFIKEDNALCPTSLRTKNILSSVPFS